jgi:cholesterol oxidase
VFQSLADWLKRPGDFFRTHILPGWAQRSTILLVMQTEDNQIQLKPGRSLWTLWRRGLVSHSDPEHPIPTHIPVAHHVTQRFAQKTNSIPAATITEACSTSYDSAYPRRLSLAVTNEVW